MNWIKSRDRHLSASEFDLRAKRAATLLESNGVGAGDGVALILRNDIAFFEASFGAGMIGAYSIPLNWHATAAEANYILNDSGAKVVVVHSDLLARLESGIPAGVKTIAVRTPGEIIDAYSLADMSIDPKFTEWNDALAAADPFAGEPSIPPSTIIYTSGTTGKPKGVRRSPTNEQQRESVARMLAMSYGYLEHIYGSRNPSEIVTAVVGPLYHAAPNYHSAFSIRSGANVIVEPKFDPEGLLAMIERERITHLNMVPIMFVRLLRLPDEIKRRYDLSSLEYVAHAAAPCAPPVKRAMIDWWGPVISEYYGTTEMGNVTWLNSEEWLAHPGSVGRAMPNTTVQIVDAEGNPVPTGTIGEVVGRRQDDGDFTYHNDPAKRATAERNGLLAPGDVGYLDADGFLYLSDRKSDMVVSGGVNIYPAEIEAEMLKLEGVEDCAVFGIPDDEFGEALHAVVQAQPGSEPDPADLLRKLRESIAGYKIPRTIEFTAALPREDSGKLFKRKLREPFWEGRDRKI